MQKQHITNRRPAGTYDANQPNAESSECKSTECGKGKLDTYWDVLVRGINTSRRAPRSCKALEMLAIYEESGTENE
jgi:hypothetical protein